MPAVAAVAAVTHVETEPSLYSLVIVFTPALLMYTTPNAPGLVNAHIGVRCQHNGVGKSNC
jgi:hypothetical protein